MPAGDVLTVQVVRPPGKGPFGDPLPGSAVEFDVEGCLFAPGPSQEMHNGANLVDTDGTVYAPPDVDVLPTDQMRVRGDLYEVVGKPQNWGVSGVVVALRLVSG